jgi:hypothetical protein
MASEHVTAPGGFHARQAMASVQASLAGSGIQVVNLLFSIIPGICAVETVGRRDFRLVRTNGDIALKNRLVMSPMTRSSALDGNILILNPVAATYCVQRASAGLIVTEATQVSPQEVGYIRTPGIHAPEQIAGWRKITETVHRAGGAIFAQLRHVGRVSHPDFHGGEAPVAASAIAPNGEVFTPRGKTKIGTPRALGRGAQIKNKVFLLDPCFPVSQSTINPWPSMKLARWGLI